MCAGVIENAGLSQTFGSPLPLPSEYWDYQVCYYYTQLVFRVENGEEGNIEDASGALEGHI